MKMMKSFTASMSLVAMERDHGCEGEMFIFGEETHYRADSSYRQLGLELKGDSANVYWGAFDAIIKTDVRLIDRKDTAVADHGL